MIALASLLSSAAAQDLVPTKICIYTQTDFGHTSPFWDWYSEPDQDRWLRGVLVRASTYGHDAEDYAVVHGSERGCATLDLLEGEEYVVSVVSAAEIDGRIVRVMDEPQIPGYPGDQLQVRSWSQDPITPYAIWNAKFVFGVPAEHHWMQLQVAGWLLHRSAWGIDPSVPLDIYMDRGPVFHPPTGTVHLARIRSPGTIAHEIGHWIQWAANAGASANRDCAADTTDCNAAWLDRDIDPAVDLTGARPMTLEHDSCAYGEGFANFVAAWAFNSRMEDDCSLREPFQFDFDLDGVVDNWTFDDGTILRADFDPPEYQGLRSCSTRPNDFNSDLIVSPPFDQAPFEQPTATWISGQDWLEDVQQSHPDGDKCQVDLRGYSTAYDYERFFWDVTTQGNVHPVQIASIIDAADPHSWNAVATPIQSSGQRRRDDVIRRLEDAFENEGFKQVFLDHRANGLDHY
jgi:hypothetical protein